ncbi:O-unit flippase-like protein [Lacticaseibacillus parahuelsenbergensis]|uniref:O-unit flippase-like protein n=1 Tax=Lacticaseibacillus parahuelsenbergensis TaxID=3068305 RepID=A0ABY9L037_9LACO|nr:O-unit flippase-like protein [Lacticaseibacillus sp. NCIMB 15471]WLV77141.1 O-unit flippase-like protein [Lacticaseibacillus sp. NCIMB 15471]
MPKQMGTSTQAVLWSYIGTFFSLSSGFLMLPFILLKLSGNDLGLWYVFLGINGLLVLFDFGFAPTFARNFAYIWSGAKKLSRQGMAEQTEGEVDSNLFRLLYQSCKVLYLVLSVIALVLLLSVGSLYIAHITANFSGEHYLTAWIVMCLSFFLNLYFDYYASILRGINEIKSINVALVISKVSQISISGILLMMGIGVLGAVLGFLAQGLIFRQYCKATFFKNIEVQRIFRQTKSDVQLKAVLDTIRTVLPNSVKDGFVSIANYAATQGSSLIISLKVSLTVVGHYSLVLQLINAVASVAVAINNAYLPTIQNRMVSRAKESLQIIIGRCQIAYISVFLGGSLGVYFVVMPIVGFLRPGFSFSVITFLLMIIYYFLFNQQSGYATYIAAANEIPYAKAFVVSSVISVVLIFISLQFFPNNLTLVIVAQILAQACFNNWYWLRYFYKREGFTFVRTLNIGLSSWIKTILRA